MNAKAEELSTKVDELRALAEDDYNSIESGAYFSDESDGGLQDGVFDDQGYLYWLDLFWRNGKKAQYDTLASEISGLGIQLQQLKDNPPANLSFDITTDDMKLRKAEFSFSVENWSCDPLVLSSELLPVEQWTSSKKNANLYKVELSPSQVPASTTTEVTITIEFLGDHGLQSFLLTAENDDVENSLETSVSVTGTQEVPAMKTLHDKIVMQLDKIDSAETTHKGLYTASKTIQQYVEVVFAVIRAVAAASYIADPIATEVDVVKDLIGVGMEIFELSVSVVGDQRAASKGKITTKARGAAVRYELLLPEVLPLGPEGDDQNNWESKVPDQLADPSEFVDYDF